MVTPMTEAREAIARNALDGNRSIPIEREALGRMVREAWVRWAKTQPSPKTSWLVPYDQLNEPDKEADRQIGEAIARWTLIHDAAAFAMEEKIADRSSDASAGEDVVERKASAGVEQGGTGDHEGPPSVNGGCGNPPSASLLRTVPEAAEATVEKIAYTDGDHERLSRAVAELQDNLSKALEALSNLNKALQRLPVGRTLSEEKVHAEILHYAREAYNSLKDKRG